MNSTVYIITFVAAFGAAAAFTVFLTRLVQKFRPQSVEERLQSLTSNRSDQKATSNLLKDDPFTNDDGGKWFKRINKELAILRAMIDQTDLTFSVSQFFAISAVSAIVGLASAVLAKTPLLLLPPIGIGFALLPLFWLMNRRARRLKRFSRQLPDALELMSRGLRAGYSVPAAIRIVVDQMLPPMSSEFARCSEQQSLGMALPDALDDMVRRIPNGELAFVAASVRLNQRMGGNLAEIFNKIASIVRERFKIMGQVQALTGEGRISGLVLLALPIVLFGVVYYLSPSYIEPLFTDPLGRRMLVVTGVLQVVGAVSIRRIVNIKL